MTAWEEPEDWQVWSPGATWWHLQALQLLHRSREQLRELEWGWGAYLILLVRSSILSIANADDDVGRAEPEVRVVSNIINAHVFLFSNQLGTEWVVMSPGALHLAHQSPARRKKQGCTLTSTSSPLGRSLNHFTTQVRPTWSPDCTTP